MILSRFYCFFIYKSDNFVVIKSQRNSKNLTKIQFEAQNSSTLNFIKLKGSFSVVLYVILPIVAVTLAGVSNFWFDTMVESIPDYSTIHKFFNSFLGKHVIQSIHTIPQDNGLSFYNLIYQNQLNMRGSQALISLVDAPINYHFKHTHLVYDSQIFFHSNALTTEAFLADFINWSSQQNYIREYVDPDDFILNPRKMSEEENINWLEAVGHVGSNFIKKTKRPLTFEILHTTIDLFYKYHAQPSMELYDFVKTNRANRNLRYDCEIIRDVMLYRELLADQANTSPNPIRKNLIDLQNLGYIKS